MLTTHKVVIPKIITGVIESLSLMDTVALNDFVNETLQSRVSRRVLAEQHLALSTAFGSKNYKKSSVIGMVDTSCNASALVKKCTSLAFNLFSQSYSCEPPVVEVDGHIDAKFAYIPDHVEYIFFELLKNSMKASYDVQERLGDMPGIKVTIGKGDNQIMFRISDLGKPNRVVE